MFNRLYWVWRRRKSKEMNSCCFLYDRNGTTTSECTFLGQWTFATLKCIRKWWNSCFLFWEKQTIWIAIDCGSPGILRHGFLSGERFDYPNIIAFFCNDGFELIGKDTTRACQENGLWSGTMPFCQSKLKKINCYLIEDFVFLRKDLWIASIGFS